MTYIKGRRTFLLRSGLWVTTGLITAGTGLSVAHAGGPEVIFYEGNNATQDVVAKYTKSYTGRIAVNDEARSVKLRNVGAATKIQVYDAPHGKTDDDHCTIDVNGPISEYIVNSFEQPFYDPVHLVNIRYTHFNGLNGKVSFARIKIVPI